MDMAIMKPEHSQQHPTSFWRHLIEQQTELFETTVSENERLAVRNRELEREVSVWKQALSKADADQEKVQRTAGGLEQQVGDLQQQLLSLQEDNPLVLALIDGDGNIFSEELLLQGAVGGRNAAALLTKGVLEALNSLNSRISQRARLWVIVFCNQQGLSETLRANDICTTEQFDSFCLGFNQAAPLFSIIDVGHGKEAADTKIKEYLRVFSRYPQTAYIFFGGGHDNGYYATLTSLETEGLLDKIVLLHGYKELALEYKHIQLQTLLIEGLFRETKVPSHFAVKKPQRPVPAVHQHRKSEDIKPTGVTKSAETLKLATGVSIAKCKPIPCTFFYLGNCAKNAKCIFGHHYELLPEHYEEMRRSSKKYPCAVINKGKVCSLGDNCISGHYCPNGKTCVYIKQGKCRFVGPDMHSKPKIASRSPASATSSIRQTPVPPEANDYAE